MKSTFKTSATLLLLATLSILVTACNTTRSIATNDGVCTVWSPLTYSASKDTPETVLGIRQNNAKRGSFCKGTKP